MTEGTTSDQEDQNWSSDQPMREDTTRRTGSSPRKSRTSLHLLHRRASKVSRSEDQKQKWSTAAFPGEERRSCGYPPGSHLEHQD
ncbi:hypothetical protein TNCV_2613181 [Trichonephila clavipes]|nr:hypothetical protein TNCV_2613181 [Trichonephila clavipes]